MLTYLQGKSNGDKPKANEALLNNSDELESEDAWVSAVAHTYITTL